MNPSLAAVVWKEFYISELFTIEIGSNVDGNKVNKESGRSAYITRKESNNGLDGFIDYQNKYLNKKYPVITIGNETAEPFVQDFSFFTGTKVNILIPKHTCSRGVLLFVAQCLKMHKRKYSYSYTINSSRLGKQIILLPADQNGLPDYDFMEAYMRDKEQHLIDRYQAYLRTRLAAFAEQSRAEQSRAEQSRAEQSRAWKEFKIKDLFRLEMGRSPGLTHLRKCEKGINYVGATNVNNGVLCQVTPDERLEHKGNAIAFIRNGEGSIGFSVYKAEKFIATSDVSVGYSKNLDRYMGTFITAIADRVRGKYNFGYKRSASRLANERLLLPALPDGTPDYDTMKNAMLQYEMKILQRYLAYRGKADSITKS